LSAQFINWFGEIRSYLPWISFMAGLGGSLHCVGMCGGLVTASCSGSRDIIRYQTGRLLGYLGLGLLAGFTGGLLDFKRTPSSIQLIPAFFIGALFIFWGYQNYRGKRAELPTPKFMGRFYTQLWTKLVKNNSGLSKSFCTGLISIFLPCGLLYGVVLGAAALQHSHEAFFSMFFFWLGTVPSMVIAPKLIQSLVRPFKARLPKTHAISLILIGLLTIGFRAGKVYQAHADSKALQPQHKMSCH
jgi:sulfite exporter TauE/SafE